MTEPLHHEADVETREAYEQYAPAFVNSQAVGAFTSKRRRAIVTWLFVLSYAAAVATDFSLRGGPFLLSVFLVFSIFLAAANLVMSLDATLRQRLLCGLSIGINMLTMTVLMSAIVGSS